MKKKALLMLSSLTLVGCLLSGCQSGSAKGTRSNPYQFGDEISFTASDSIYDYQIDYTLSFSDFYDGTEMQQMYPDYAVDTDYAVRGNMSVDCKDTDDGINHSVNLYLLTSDLNEMVLSTETFVKGSLNNWLQTVYSDGNYDIIGVTNKVDEYPLDFSYLAIKYMDKSNKQQTIWIEIPDDKKQTETVSMEESESSEDVGESVSSDTTSEQSTTSETSSEETSRESASVASETSSEEAEELSYTEVSVGDIITQDFATMSLDKVSWSDEIKPSDISGVYSYYSDQEGESYFWLSGTIKNLSGDSFSIENMAAEFIFDDKYTYSGIIIADDGGNDFYFTDYVQPLGSVKYYIYYSIPDELKNSYSSCVIRFGFKDSFDSGRYSSFLMEDECDYRYEIHVSK